MPSFRHSPSGRIIEASGVRARRYRRHHAFTELSSGRPTESDTDNHYQSLPSDPESPTTPPDHTAESPQIGEDAPHSPETSVDDPDTTDIANMTVAEVLELVGTDRDKARRALTAELAGRHRVTLTSKLQRI